MAYPTENFSDVRFRCAWQSDTKMYCPRPCLGDERYCRWHRIGRKIADFFAGLSYWRRYCLLILLIIASAKLLSAVSYHFSYLGLQQGSSQEFAQNPMFVFLSLGLFAQVFALAIAGLNASPNEDRWILALIFVVAGPIIGTSFYYFQMMGLERLINMGAASLAFVGLLVASALEKRYGAVIAICLMAGIALILLSGIVILLFVFVSLFGVGYFTALQAPVALTFFGLSYIAVAIDMWVGLFSKYGYFLISPYRMFFVLELRSAGRERPRDGLLNLPFFVLPVIFGQYCILDPGFLKITTGTVLLWGVVPYFLVVGPLLVFAGHVAVWRFLIKPQSL